MSTASLHMNDTSELQGICRAMPETYALQRKGKREREIRKVQTCISKMSLISNYYYRKYIFCKKKGHDAIHTV